MSAFLGDVEPDALEEWADIAYDRERDREPVSRPSMGEVATAGTLATMDAAISSHEVLTDALAAWRAEQGRLLASA
jgi:hypothetical protein